MISPRRAGLVLLLAFVVLYGLTLDNGLRPGELEGGDLITHQYAQVLGRPSNAPGYPLYTMGGWLWFRVGRLLLGPAHNPIPLLSSYSTLWALVALSLLYVLLLEIGAKPPVAFLTAAFYGLTYFFWYYAVTTEQYTSSVAWTLAVVLLAFRWERTRRDAYLLGLALLAGVGLAHQVTVLLILPPLLWFVLGAAPGLLRRPRLLFGALGLAALPLLSYAFVYVRGAQHPEWRGAGDWANTWEWFLAFISTQQGRGELTWALRPFFTAEFPALIWREMTWPGLLAGLVGIALLGRRRAVFLYATLALYALFAWVDRLGNWYQVIMPAYALLALGMGASASWLVRQARTPALRAAVLVALAALVLARGALSYPRADASNRPDDTALAPAWAIIGDAPPAGTAVFGTLAESLALDYLTRVWGVRPDLRSVNATQAEEMVTMGAPLVAATEAMLPLIPSEVRADAHYSALGRTLAAVSARPEGAPVWTQSAGRALDWRHDFEPEVRLIGAQVRRNDATQERVLLLAWEALQPVQDWSVSVRLTRQGEEIAQVDRTHPVMGAYPTSRWTTGEVIGDAYAFPETTAAQADGATVILYRQRPDGAFENLDVVSFPLPQP